MCEEDAYFQEMVRYIHLNPLRARIVRDLAQLDRCRWCGHAAELRNDGYPWQDRKYVLAWFERREVDAVRAYRNYVREGIPRGRRPNLAGGGLIRSLGGRAEVRAVRRRQEPMLAHPRILGTGPFVERMLQAGDERLQTARNRAKQLRAAQTANRQACAQAGIGQEELRQGSRRHRIRVVRTQLALLLVTDLGLPLADAVRLLGVSTSGIAKTLARTGK